MREGGGYAEKLNAVEDFLAGVENFPVRGAARGSQLQKDKRGNEPYGKERSPNR